jgi:hypothetical protein
MPDDTTPEGLTIPEGGTISDAQKQSINTNFRGAMSEEYGTHASMADYQDLDGWGKSHVNQQKLIGGEKLPMPQKDWGKEEWTDFNKKIGMPTDTAGYELADHEGATDVDKEWFAKMAHEKLMLSKRQANEMWKEMNDRSKTDRDAGGTKNQNRLDDGYTELKKDWGGEENYKKMVDSTNKGLDRLDEDGRFRKWMKDTGLNKEPEMLRFAAKVAGSFQEDRAPGDISSPMPMSKEQATAQLNKLFSEAHKDPKHPLMNKKDPAHADEVKKVTKLSTIAGGA